MGRPIFSRGLSPEECAAVVQFCLSSSNESDDRPANGQVSQQ